MALGTSKEGITAMRNAASTTTLLTVAAGCAAILALAGCGSPDEADASPGGAGSPATVTAATPTADPALAEALIDAATAGDATELKKLLAAGAVPGAGVAQSVIFGEKDDPALLKILFEAGLDPNLADAISPQHTILMWTAEAGHPKMTKAVLDAGADIDKVDLYGDPAVSVAGFVGDLAVVKVLVEHGAALDLRGFEGNNAVQHSRSQGNEEIAKYLIAHGAPE